MSDTNREWRKYVLWALGFFVTGFLLYTFSYEVIAEIIRRYFLLPHVLNAPIKDAVYRTEELLSLASALSYYVLFIGVAFFAVTIYFSIRAVANANGLRWRRLTGIAIATFSAFYIASAGIYAIQTYALEPLVAGWEKEEACEAQKKQCYERADDEIGEALEYYCYDAKYAPQADIDAAAQANDDCLSSHATSSDVCRAQYRQRLLRNCTYLETAGAHLEEWREEMVDGCLAELRECK